MKYNENISDELLNIAPTITGILKGATYTIPTNYFDGLSATILTHLKAGKEPTYHFSKEMPLTLPANYFQDLPRSILQKIQSAIPDNNTFDELEAISPLLNTIRKKNPYTLPVGYFKNLQP